MLRTPAPEILIKASGTVQRSTLSVQVPWVYSSTSWRIALSMQLTNDWQHICRSMLDGPTTPEVRAMLIELALSIPARLSDLLVVLTSLMRPLVMALQEGQELVALGLRTLEYWVDRWVASPAGSLCPSFTMYLVRLACLLCLLAMHICPLMLEPHPVL